MRRFMGRRMRRYALMTVIAVAPITVICAYATNLLVPTLPLPRPATSYSILPTASIVDSSQTVGIADSNLYALSNPDGSIDTTAIDQHFAEMQALGVTTVRVDIPWAGVVPLDPTDPSFGSYRDWSRADYIVNEAASKGISVIAVLNATPYYGGQNGNGCFGCVGAAPDPTKFAAFAAEVAGRFRGEVSAYEVWNEPNYFGSWSPAVDPVAYTNVLKAAYAAIKTPGVNTVGGVQVPTGDPNAMVVAGVLGAVQSLGNITMDPRTFVQTMYANGAKGFFDALSFHPYNYDLPFSQGLSPGITPGTGCDPAACNSTPISMLLGIRQAMLDAQDGGTKIWATEYGLPTSMVTQQKQSDFITDFLNTWANGPSLAQTPLQYQALVQNWSSWLGPAFIYTLQDQDPTTEQGSFGVFTNAGMQKLAAAAIQQIIQQRQQPTDLGTFLAQAFAALFNQVGQTLGQQIANSLAQALANWLSNLFSPPAPAAAATTLGLTTDQQQAVVEGVSTAALSMRSVTVGAAADTSATNADPATDASAATAKTSASESVGAAVTAAATTEPAATTASTTTTQPAGTTQPAATTQPVATTASTTTTEPAATTDATATGGAPAEESTPSDQPATSDKPAATDDRKTADHPNSTGPNRRDNGDEAQGDSKKDDGKKSHGDADADGATAGGKHAKGASKDGTSVDEIKAKLGADAAGTDTTNTAKAAESGGSSAAA